MATKTNRLDGTTKYKLLVRKLPVSMKKPGATGDSEFDVSYYSRSAHVMAFQDAIVKEFKKCHDGPPIKGPWSIRAVLVYPRPATYTEKKYGEFRSPYMSRHDSRIDVLAKIIVESLNGLAWPFPHCVINQEVSKWIAGPKEPPHCEITLLYYSDIRSAYPLMAEEKYMPMLSQEDLDGVKMGIGKDEALRISNEYLKKLCAEWRWKSADQERYPEYHKLSMLIREIDEMAKGNGGGHQG